MNFIFIMHCVKALAIPFPHQPPTRGYVRVSVAMAVLPPLALIATFATGQGMRTNTAKLPHCSFKFVLVLKVLAFRC